MPDLNKVMLMGNLTRDPEIKYTPKGMAVVELSVAVNESYKAHDGTIKESVLYVDIEVWGRQAETSKEYLHKGSALFVEGRLRLDQWENAQGEKKKMLRVRADRIQFLRSGSGGPNGGNRQSSSGSYDEKPQSRENPPPPARQARSSAFSEDSSSMPEDQGDDIPF